MTEVRLHRLPAIPERTGLEVTDHGRKMPGYSRFEEDVFLREENPQPKKEEPEKQAEAAWGAVRWLRRLLSKRVSPEVAEIAGKLDRLASAPKMVADLSFKNDYPRLMALALENPQEAQRILSEAFRNSATPNESEPWLLLAKIGIGGEEGHEAFIRMIEIMT